MSFWKDKRVVVTGGSGFLGGHIVELLQRREASANVPRSRDVDLRDIKQVDGYFSSIEPQIVIHSAAFYGGIWINQLYPGKIYYDNLVMSANVMEAARKAGVEKFIGIGTACSYPGYQENYLSEDGLWDGLPHETVVNYGMVKKMMLIQGMAYRKQWDFKSIHLILTNLYGPGDTFNPDRSHVVSALIRKFVEAKLNGLPEVEVWGSGKPVREFLYVEDCAEAVVLASELYDDPLPLNIGTGIGTSIRELAETISELTGYEGEISWNRDKPDGQMVKILDVTRMKEHLNGWEPRFGLRDGLGKTIEWYRANKEEADKRF